MSANSLPPEIWFSILDLATYAPRSLEPDIYSVAGWSRLMDGSLRVVEEICNSLEMKRACVRVCRCWRALALPLLYGCLVLRKGPDIPVLLDTLLAYQTNHRPLASLVKRLDVAFISDSEWCLTKGELALLPKLLRLLPNLAILHVCVNPADSWQLPWPSSATDALIDTCAQSLRVVQWSTPEMSLTPQELFRLLSWTSNLRLLAPWVLRAPLRLPSNIIQRNLSGASFDKLAVLVLTLCERTTCGELANLAFPSLRELHIKCSHFGDLRSSQLLTVHGGQLTRFGLTMAYDPWWETLIALRELCPHLLILELQFIVWERPNGPLVLPSISELWLQCLFPRRVPEIVTFFLEHLSATEPSLKACRLNCPTSSNCMRQPEHVPLLADWRARVPVALLDDEGLPF